MVKTSGRILRSEDVKLDGQYRLDMGRTHIVRDGPQQKKAVSVPTKVCILEQHSEYAVLEVSCACGAKICVRCEYTGSKVPDNSQTLDGTTVESSETN